MSKNRIKKMVIPEDTTEITVKMNMNTYRRLVKVSQQLHLTPNQFIDKIIGDVT